MKDNCFTEFHCFLSNLSEVFLYQATWYFQDKFRRHEYILYAKLLLLCLTLCDPMDCSPPGTSVHGIFQARMLEWVALPSSKWSSRPRDLTSPALAGSFFTTSATWETLLNMNVSCSVMSDSLQPHELLPARFFSTRNSPCKNTGVGSHSFLQGIFLTQGSNLSL